MVQQGLEEARQGKFVEGPKIVDLNYEPLSPRHCRVQLMTDHPCYGVLHIAEFQRTREECVRISETKQIKFNSFLHQVEEFCEVESSVYGPEHKAFAGWFIFYIPAIILDLGKNVDLVAIKNLMDYPGMNYVRNGNNEQISRADANKLINRILKLPELKVFK